jgi:hypothetical protein
MVPICLIKTPIKYRLKKVKGSVEKMSVQSEAAVDPPPPTSHMRELVKLSDFQRIQWRGKVSEIVEQLS